VSSIPSSFLCLSVVSADRFILSPSQRLLPYASSVSPPPISPGHAGSNADTDTPLERPIWNVAPVTFTRADNVACACKARANPLPDLTHLYRYHVSLPPGRRSASSRPVPPFNSCSISSFNFTPFNSPALCHLIPTQLRFSLQLLLLLVNMVQDSRYYTEKQSWRSQDSRTKIMMVPRYLPVAVLLELLWLIPCILPRI
jgi:hypothetical protein